MEKEYNVDTNVLWNRLTDLVVKTIISTESPINKLVDANRNSGYNCYELFGVDVLFDQQLKPWLLEVGYCLTYLLPPPPFFFFFNNNFRFDV